MTGLLDNKDVDGCDNISPSVERADGGFRKRASTLAARVDLSRPLEAGAAVIWEEGKTARQIRYTVKRRKAGVSTIESQDCETRRVSTQCLVDPSSSMMITARKTTRQMVDLERVRSDRRRLLKNDF